MSDVTERLRAGTGGGKEWMALHKEAADEIERLRAELTDIYDRLQSAHEERDALQARIDSAQIVKATAAGAIRPEPRMTYIGKRVALVVLEAGK